MPAKNPDLHGNVPDSAEAALVLIDVINALDFEKGEQLLEQALPMAHNLAQLRRHCKAAGLPVIYANDNFGKWQSDFHAVVQHCLNDEVPGKPIAQLLKPDADDYFVLKPKHSGFFATTLETLLEYLGVTTLILTGIAGNICVLFTAHDAHMRDLRLYVPRDCVASNTAEENEAALRHIENVLQADTRPGAEIDIKALAGERAKRAA